MIQEPHSRDVAVSEIALSAILLGRNDDAQRLLTTCFGTESALNFCLRHWTAARRPGECLLVMPEALEQPHRREIAAAAESYGMRVVAARNGSLLRDLGEATRQADADWIAITPATSVFVDENMIDACLTLLARTAADYVLGDGYPSGARPLAVRREVLDMLASDITPTSLQAEEIPLYLRELPAFRGVVFPAPPSLEAPGIDLSLASAHRSTELEAITRRIVVRREPIALKTVLRAMRHQRQTRLRAAFRTTRLRPRARPHGEDATTGVLCLSFRSEKVSGGDTSLHNLIGALDRTRFRPLLAAPSATGTLVEAARRRGVPTTYVPFLAGSAGEVSAALTASVGLGCFASRHHADLVYANSTTVARLGAITAFILGIPFIARVIEELDPSILDASLIAFADRIAVPSRYMADYCESLGIPADRLRVVHEGLTPEWFQPAPRGEDVRQRCGFDRNAPLIGVVSRLDDPRKGLDRIVRAAAEIVAERPDVRMVICGKTGLGAASEQARLQDSIGQLGLTDHVRIVGFLADMRPVYPQLDLLLHPAHREPFGFVILEAMAMGVPPVAVCGGGAPEQIQHGRSGLLLERSDAHLFAQAALDLLERPELRRQMGQQAREYVRLNYTNDKFTRGMELVFDELVPAHRPNRVGGDRR